MIAIDTLVHNFLHRTGILRRFNARARIRSGLLRPKRLCGHYLAYCKPHRCTRVQSEISEGSSRASCNTPSGDTAARSGLGICNGNEIDDRFRCGNEGCPLFNLCSRVALHPIEATAR